MLRIKRKVTLPLFGIRKTSGYIIKVIWIKVWSSLKTNTNSHKFYTNKFRYQYPAQPVMAIVSHFPPPLSPLKLPYVASYISPRKCLGASWISFSLLQVIFSRKLVDSSISKAIDPSPLLTIPDGPNSWIKSPFGIPLVTNLFNFGQEGPLKDYNSSCVIIIISVENLFSNIHQLILKTNFQSM